MVGKSSSSVSEKKSVMNKEMRLRMLKRNQCLKKKTMELSTLCGIDAMIICLGNDGEISDTWPEQNPQIESVINRYRDYMINEKEREKAIEVKKKKKKGSSSSILSANPSFDEKELREYEMELEKIIQTPSLDDERLEDFSTGKELNELRKMELDEKKNNNNRGGGGVEGKEEECINSSLVPCNEDPSMVLNFDTMMSSKFAEESPSFASCSSYSEFLVEEDEKEGFLWDYEFASSSWSLSPSLLPPVAAVASSSEEFSVQGYFDDTALSTVEEVLRLCTNTATFADDRFI